MRNRCSVLTDLFLSFAKVGCFTFGGGYSMISVITDTCVEKKKWISHDEMMNVTVIAESTPGPIAINCATYVGYKLAGMAGAVVATLGIVVPSFVIIYLISNFLDNFLAYPLVTKAFLGIKVGVGMGVLKNTLKNKYVQAILRGLKPCIIGIILATGIYMTLHHCVPMTANTFLDISALCVAVVLITAAFLYKRLRRKKLSPIALIVLSAILGILLY